MAAEAQKVIPGKTSTRHGTQEMSIARPAEVLDHIVRLLEPLPPHERLLLLREAEARLISHDKTIKKVSKLSRSSFAVYVANDVPLGEYKVRIENGKLIYEPVEGRGDARVKKYGSRAPRLSIPKWAYEAIGSPMFVRLRLENGKIIIEPV